ncbi:MAG TPA: hypothetical protein VJX30_03085 [Terriglobales bacterium]|nr:hypothetical protein [Terriglobales bacterium]
MDDQWRSGGPGGPGEEIGIPASVGWSFTYPDDNGIIHVLPNFGRGHDTTANVGLACMCWCGPGYEQLEDGRVLVIHELDN